MKVNTKIVVAVLLAVSGTGYAGGFGLDGIKAADVKKASSEAVVPAVSAAAAEGPAARAGYGDWKHIELNSDNGVKVKIDYQLASLVGNMVTAGPVWLNVYFPADAPVADSAGRVKVVFINYRPGDSWNEPAWASTYPEYRELDLSLVDYDAAAKTAKATAELPFGTRKGLVPGGYQEVAVVIDGKWHKDPKTGGNFRIDMRNIKNY